MDENLYPKSPVPSDAFLLPGELPFTAFGQFGEGKIDLRVFDQNIYWVNNMGEPFLIEEMTTTYMENVLGFIVNNAVQFHNHLIFDEQVKLILELTFNMPGEATAALMLEELTLAEGDPETSFPVLKADLTTEEWLTTTPLYVKFINLLGEQKK